MTIRIPFFSLLFINIPVGIHIKSFDNRDIILLLSGSLQGVQKKKSNHPILLQWHEYFCKFTLENLK